MTATTELVERALALVRERPGMAESVSQVILELVDAVPVSTLASRKPEAAPSDTDHSTLIYALRRKAFFFKRHWSDGENETHLLLNTAADALSRTSQPVQVEVTTAEELDALPLDAVVVDFAGVPRTKRAGNSHMPGGWTHAGNSPLRSRELADGRPMQVIYAGRIALGGGE